MTSGKCSNGGTLDEHNVSSRFGCVWRCHKALNDEKMTDATKTTCNWYLKSPEEIRKVRADEETLEDQAIKREIWENAGMEGYDRMEAEQEAEAKIESQDDDRDDQATEFYGREPEEYPAGVDGGEVDETERLPAYLEDKYDQPTRPEDIEPRDDDPEAEEVRKEDEASAISSEQAERESY